MVHKIHSPAAHTHTICIYLIIARVRLRARLVRRLIDQTRTPSANLVCVCVCNIVAGTLQANSFVCPVAAAAAIRIVGLVIIITNRVLSCAPRCIRLPKIETITTDCGVISDSIRCGWLGSIYLAAGCVSCQFNLINWIHKRTTELEIGSSSYGFEWIDLMSRNRIHTVFESTFSQCGPTDAFGICDHFQCNCHWSYHRMWKMTYIVFM